MSSPFSFSVRDKSAKRKRENNVDAETEKKYRAVYSEKKGMLYRICILDMISLTIAFALFRIVGFSP